MYGEKMGVASLYLYRMLWITIMEILLFTRGTRRLSPCPPLLSDSGGGRMESFYQGGTA
jgi:hypothetical protein